MRNMRELKQALLTLNKMVARYLLFFLNSNSTMVCIYGRDFPLFFK